MKFSLYTLSDADYAKHLLQVDKRVPFSFSSKAHRPFLGIILCVNGLYYYAPLTSPKEKHLKMKNQIDFIKINSGHWGAINLNNMIPIHPAVVTRIDFHKFNVLNKDELNYKNLLENQISWCNINKSMILQKSQKLYAAITKKKAHEQLTQRCCDFKLLEEKCIEYCKLHNLELPLDPEAEKLKREASELLEQMKHDKEKSASGSGRGR